MAKLILVARQRAPSRLPTFQMSPAPPPQHDGIDSLERRAPCGGYAPSLGRRRSIHMFSITSQPSSVACIPRHPHQERRQRHSRSTTSLCLATRALPCRTATGRPVRPNGNQDSRRAKTSLGAGAGFTSSRRRLLRGSIASLQPICSAEPGSQNTERQRSALPRRRRRYHLAGRDHMVISKIEVEVAM